MTVPAVKTQQPPRTSVLVPNRARPAGAVGSKATSFSQELQPVPPVHLDAQDMTIEGLSKKFLDATETLRRATLPMRQNPAGAPSHSRGIVTTATPAAPQIVLVPHALGRPATGAHVCRHQGVPWEGNETVPGSVAYVAVTNGGSAYTTPPAVTVTGGGGTGVQAEAVLQDGAVSYVRLRNAGSGHVSAPNVTFTGGGGTGATATATMPRTDVDPNKAVQMVTTSSGTYDFQTWGD
jgi:hypothetical protein